MPANSKYLEKSGWQRFLKISAGLVGGFTVPASFFLMLAALFPGFRPQILMSFYYGGFLIWIPLLMFAFLFKNGWHCWLLYGGITLLFCCGVILFNN